MIALAGLFWIPTHIVTFSIRYEQDYRSAGVPMFPSTYGVRTTRVIIALSSLAAGAAMIASAAAMGLSWGYLRLLTILSLGLLSLAFASLAHFSKRSSLGLFKYASTYMPDQCC